LSFRGHASCFMVPCSWFRVHGSGLTVLTSRFSRPWFWLHSAKAHTFRAHGSSFTVLSVGGVSSAAVRSALVASSRSHRENGENGENKPVGENGENTPVGDDGGNRPSGSTSRSGRKNPDGDDGEDIPVGYS